MNLPSGRHKALLSFGEEDEEENEKEDDREKSKIMSAHDISGDQKLGQKVAQVSENKIEQLKSRIRRLERKEPSADLPPSDQKVSLSDEQGADVREGDDEAGASVPAQAEVTATAGEDTAETARRDDLIEEAYKMRRGEGGKIRQAGLGSEARNKQQADLLDDNERGGSRVSQRIVHVNRHVDVFIFPCLAVEAVEVQARYGGAQKKRGGCDGSIKQIPRQNERSDEQGRFMDQLRRITFPGRFLQCLRLRCSQRFCMS